MQERVVIVSLDMDIRNPSYLAYKKSSAKQKIQSIAQAIEEVCAHLQNTKPNCKWIITWSEYGVQDEDARTVDVATKKILKETMAKLRWKFSNLEIIAGTVATRKQTTLIKSGKLLEYYAEHETISKKEEIFGARGRQISKHREMVKKLFSKKQIQIDNKKNKDFQLVQAPVYIIRNTCYIFPRSPIYLSKTYPSDTELTHLKGSYIFITTPPEIISVNLEGEIEKRLIENKEKFYKLIEMVSFHDASRKSLQDYLSNNQDLLNEFIQLITQDRLHTERISRIDKTAPFDELIDALPQKIEPADAVFKIGGKKGRNMSHIVNKNIIEICREHFLGVGIDELKNISHNHLLHFVISDSMDINLCNIGADFAILIDTQAAPVLVVMTNESEKKASVELYQYKFLEKYKEKMLLPITATYPFILFLKEEIKNIISTLPDGELQAILYSFNNDLSQSPPINISLSADESEAYIKLTKFFSELKANIKNYPETLKKINNFEILLNFNYQREKSGLKIKSTQCSMFISQKIPEIKDKKDNKKKVLKK